MSDSSSSSEDEEESARFELPRMLYRMLYEVSSDEEESKIVSWQDHGRSFRVHNREEFERILSRYFREQYESWKCLLEQWGFLKLTRGKDRGSWYHCNFYRGNSAKLQNITKDEFTKGMPTYLSPREEPNLYGMPVAKENLKDKIPLKDAAAAAAATSTDRDTPPSNNKRRPSMDKITVGKGDISQPSNKKMKHSQTKSAGAAKSSSSSSSSLKQPTTSAFAGQEGCQVCGVDDDHGNLLVCEICETEMHTYCLNPPLDSVPEDDWFCDACSARRNKDRDELDQAINQLPEEFIKRFGEICWARSGDRAEWWPAEICDPRSFLNNEAVVDLAKRSLGKRHLVFFFEIQVTPFDAVPNSRILSWEEGVNRQLHTGRHIRGSKERFQRFDDALSIAQTERTTDPSERTWSPARTHVSSSKDGQRKTGNRTTAVTPTDSKRKNQRNVQQQQPKKRTKEEERARLIWSAPICRYYASPLF